MNLSRLVTLEEMNAAKTEKNNIPLSWNSLDFVKAVAKSFLLSDSNCSLVNGKYYASKTAAYILKSAHVVPEYFITYTEIKNPDFVVKI
jgi:uncharacterized membrane protein